MFCRSLSGCFRFLLLSALLDEFGVPDQRLVVEETARDERTLGQHGLEGGVQERVAGGKAFVGVALEHELEQVDG